MKNQIYIFFDDSQAMEGEPIQAANEALRLLLGAWSKDPCWRENLEVEIWLASGKIYACYADLKQLTLENEITCSSVNIQDESVEKTLSRLLKIPYPNEANYYQPQLIVLSSVICKSDELTLMNGFNKSPFTDVLLLETGNSEPVTRPFACRSWKVDELDHYFACGLICQKPFPTLPEWSHILAERLQQVANQGDMDAQFKLANMYRRGLGVRRSMNKAQEWFLCAAEQNHVEALFQLGELHWLGLIEKADKAEAARLYLQAAKLKSLEAMYRLGILYKYGQGLPSDDLEALNWWQQAAGQGHVEAKREVEKMYRYVN